MAQVTTLSTRAFVGDDDFPRYEEVRRFAAQATVARAKSTGTDENDLLALYEAENERLRDALSSLKSENDAELQLASDELQRAEGVRDAALAERGTLRTRLLLLEKVLRDRGQAVQDQPLEHFEEIEEWCTEHLIGSIWVSRKAIRETEKNGQFQDTELFGRTLLMLRDIFVAMKRNPGIERRETYDQALRDLGLTDEACFSQKGAIKSFPEYKVTYDGNEYWCEDHIKYGGGNDSKTFFRIYYHWHEQDQIMLIGHMPTHLDNKLTN